MEDVDAEKEKASWDGEPVWLCSRSPGLKVVTLTKHIRKGDGNSSGLTAIICLACK